MAPMPSMARHPFDMRSSGRDPFPCFDAAMRHVAASDHSDDDNNTRSSDTGSDTESENAQFRPRNDQDRRWCKQENDDNDCDGGCDSPSECDCADPRALRWSIDALATLLPIAISPLPQQRQQQQQQQQHNQHSDRCRRRWTTEGDDRFTSFFEDEEQFCVLRTPAAIIERERRSPMQQSSATGSVSASGGGGGERGGGGGGGAAAYARWRSPEGIRWRDLHRRCVETMELCDERLRERQHKLRKLSIPASKLKLKRRSSAAQSTTNQRRSSSSTTTTTSTTTRPWTTPPLSTAPTQPSTLVTPVRRSVVPPAREREPLTPVGFGAIDLSPIPKESAAQTKATPSDSFSLPCRSSSTTSSSSARTSSGALHVSGFLSPALSSIAEHASDVLTPSFASLRFATSDCEQNDDHEQKENKENTTPPPASRLSHSAYNNNSSYSSCSSSGGSSLRTMSLLRHGGADGEDGEDGGGGGGGGGAEDSLLWSASSSSPSLPSSSLCSSPFTPPHSFPQGDAASSSIPPDQDSEAIAIARRQRSFLAAIEEEAQLRDAEIKQQTQREQLHTPVRKTPGTQPHSGSATEESESDAATDDGGATTTPRRRMPSLLPGGSPLPLSQSHHELQVHGPQRQIASPPATSMAAIYKEARALGITEPTAQWEYVQLISRQTAAQRRLP